MSKRSRKKENPPAYNDLFFSKTNDFLNVYLMKQASYSIHTKKAYRIGLAAFYDYVTTVRHIPPMTFAFSQCNYQLILEYSQYMQESLHYARGTVNARLAVIRSYLAYVSDGDVALTSVFLSVCKVPMRTVVKSQRPIIQPKDLSVFLDSPKHTKTGNRDRFILILLYDSAIRVGELVQITLGDLIIDGKQSSILIHGKGRKERCIALSDKASAHLQAYTNVYHPGDSEPKRPLIYTVIHGHIHHMSKRNVERILTRYGDLAREEAPDIPKQIYPHLLRRTRASTLYRDGTPLEQVSALLGHQQIETTRTHYASPSVDQLREVVNRGINQEPEQTQEWIGHEAEIKKKFGLS